MSFLAKLIIDDQEFNVLEFDFGVKQETNTMGIPCGRPHLQHINILFESTVESNDFYAWSIENYEEKEGEIVFFKRDTMASSRTLKFSRAHCVGYRELFDNSSKSPMVTKVELKAACVSIDDVEYEEHPQLRI